jgi:hypothetical protein
MEDCNSQQKNKKVPEKIRHLSEIEFADTRPVQIQQDLRQGDQAANTYHGKHDLEPNRPISH